MCLLILLRGVDPDYPIIVANNRDEFRARKAAPPGLYVGAHHRMLSPRDRVARGTWIAINDAGMFAGITNLADIAGAAAGDAAAADPDGNRARPAPATSRGELPHLALDQSDLAAAAAAVSERCTGAAFDPFQLLISDGFESKVLIQRGGELETITTEATTMVLTNHHRLGELRVPELPAAAAQGLELDRRLALLRAILRDTGAASGHPILKSGGDYGTVSSSLIAVPPPSSGSGLVWRYAPGPPDVTAYRNYGNLGRRLAQV